MRLLKRFCLTLMGAAGALALAPAAAQAADCDRACLEGVMNQYLDAMVAHDPSKAPFAANARFTENAMELKLPDGLWRTIGRLGEFRIYVADPKQQSVGILTTGEENNASLQLGVRLKVVDGKITEAETLVYRHSPLEANGGVASLPPNLRKPRPQFSQTLAPNERQPREKLIDINNAYWEALELNDGKDVPPFADDCHRYEGGRATTNVIPSSGALPGAASMSCKDAFANGYYREDTRLTHRRFMVVDEERGLVYQSVVMDHDAVQFRRYKLNDGRDNIVTRTAPWSWLVHVVIQVDKNGKISQIEGLPLAAPYGIDPNWTTGEKRTTSVQDGPKPW